MVAFMIVSWALSFVLGKIALREIPPLVLPGIRIGLATLCLIPIYLWKGGRRPFARQDFPRLIVVSLCGITFNQFFFITGLSRTSVAHMAVFIAISPILVLIFAVIAGQERFTIGKSAGMLIAMAGVLALELSKTDSGISTPLGDLLAFLGVVAFSIYTVAGKKFATQYGSVPMNLLSYSIGAVTLLPLSFVERSSFQAANVSATAWLSLAYMVIFSSVGTYLIYYYALAHMPASRLTTFTYAEPVLATILGYFFLGEPITWTLGAGGGLVLIGVWIAETR
jgi:drug/metabolite transporter (DMT)-like permease